MLPYLRDRPLNVHRWPDGVTGRTRFWQKQIPSHAPDWVARWDYPEAGHDQSHTYVVADRVATMAWLANHAVIDLHPWTSRLPEYWRPTYAYIDIDPGEQTTWPEVVTLARLYRTALGHLGVRGYPKVTGKRGIQVWIHVQPRYTFDETRDWVGELSRGVGAVVPDLVSWEWGKADRGGRARLDYTQNAHHQDARGALRRAARADGRRLRARSPGRSWTTRRCDRASGTCAPSSSGSRRSATSSAASWATRRRCRRLS